MEFRKHRNQHHSSCAELLKTPYWWTELMPKICTGKIDTQTNQVKSLSQVAQSEPLFSYIVYTHNLQDRWKYLQRTLKNVPDLMKPLQELGLNIVKLLQHVRTCLTWIDITAVPTRQGTGTSNPALHCQQQNRNSNFLTKKYKEPIIWTRPSSWQKIESMKTYRSHLETVLRRKYRGKLMRKRRDTGNYCN